MSRFYVKPEDVKGDEILVSKEEAHHILDVMRMAKGDKIVAFDGTGREYAGVIVNASKNDLRIRVDKINTAKTDKKFHITLAQAIPKKAKMDFIVEKATELGVDEIIPVVSERTIARPREEKMDKKIERWKDIAITASKQCGRLDIPKVRPPLRFDDFLNEIKNYDLAMMACLDSHTKPLKDVITGFKVKKVLIMIGPEGDFSPQEIEAAKSQGANLVTFGRLVLRVDTAAIFILSILNYANNSI